MKRCLACRWTDRKNGSIFHSSDFTLCTKKAMNEKIIYVYLQIQIYISISIKQIKLDYSMQKQLVYMHL